jgi:hypothetical protein
MVRTDSTALDGELAEPVDATPSRTGRARVAGNRLFLVAAAVVIIATAAITAAALALNDGHLAYTLDDSAIHLSIVRQFVHHGTWGVTTGRYESASSSPGWDLLLSAFTFVLPFAWNALPLILNVVAGLWLLWLFIDNQDFVDGTRPDRLTLLFIVLVPVFVLYIPALALVGMEHTLHAALVVQALVLFQRLVDRGATSTRALMPFYVVMFLGTLVRYETAFVAVGCVVALTAAHFGLGQRRFDTRTTVRIGAGTLIASGLPIAAIGIVNKAYGEGFFPNSIVAKSTLRTGWSKVIPSPAHMADTLQSDPLVLVLGLIALAYVIGAAYGGRNRNAGISLIYVVTVTIHVAYAQFGGRLPYARYQQYLVIAGAFVAFRIGGELLSGRRRSAAIVFGLVAILILANLRIQLTEDAPAASQNTYRQRYQLGKFFAKYYDGRPIATGELGYVTLFHNGPVVDFFGLGDHEVLTELNKTRGKKAGDPSSLSKAFLSSLIKRRHVVAIGVYSATLYNNVPSDWLLTGEWKLHGKNVTAFDRTVQFYAPTKALSDELNANLKKFNATLPAGMTSLDRDQLLAQYARTLRRFGIGGASNGGGSSTTTSTTR